MNLKERSVNCLGETLCPGFRETASAFGAGPEDPLGRFNSVLAHARANLPRLYRGGAPLASLADVPGIPALDRATLNAGLNKISGGRALARLKSGGTGRSGRVETALAPAAVLKRYAALLAVLGATGWKMGDRTAAFHPVEYSYFRNFASEVKKGAVGGLFFEFFQQYVLYRLIHNRSNIYYGGGIFSSKDEGARLLAAAMETDPVLLITRPDALLAALKTLDGKPAPFKRLKAVLTVGAVLSPAVRSMAEKLLGARVLDMYASTELGYVALSCGAPGGLLHVNEADYLAETGPDGELIITDFNNRLMPMIRYRTGDAGELLKSACSCGKTSVMLRVRGRTGSFLEAGDGRKLYEADILDLACAIDAPFFQAERTSDGGVLLRVSGSNPAEAAVLAEKITLALGSGRGRVTCLPGSAFKISSSGKFCFLP